MVKFGSNESDLDILDWSKYRPGTLNRQIIILLLTLGVNPEAFQELQNENLKVLESNNIKVK
jgi:RNA-dependent RNA polymerase